MARTRAATYDDQRALILARAAELFARRGFSAATMNDVAAACAVGKATLYHYFRDKRSLVAQIALAHVQRLEALVAETRRARLAPEAELRTLIERFMTAYADAQHEHRVLTEDVKFLDDDERAEVLASEKRVVAAFAGTIARVRPDLKTTATPLAMLLFGMINWTFTWLKPGGALTHEALAPMVTQLFFGGLPAVASPSVARRRGVSRSAGAALPA
jgi:TetR/AcrR family transcriptional regulator